MNLKLETLKIYLLGALLCLAECSVANPITLEPYDAEPKYAKFSIPPTIPPGELIYTYDNATITSAGIPWPWDNLLVHRKFSADGKANSPKGFKVFRQRGDFVSNPQWIDSQRVLIEVGNPISSYGTYDLGLWNTSTTSVETLARNLSWKQVWPSLSGRYIAFLQGGGEVPFGVGTPASFCTLNLQTKEKKVWPGFPAGIGNFWTPDDKILFTSFDKAEVEEKSNASQSQNSEIQSGDVRSGVSSKVLNKAFDGKWMTYFTIPPPSEEEKAITPDPTMPRPRPAPDLMVSAANGKNPKKVASLVASGITIIWRPDSSGFILCQRRNIGKTQNKRVVEILISAVQTEDAKIIKLGTVRYLASDGTETSADDLLWRALRVTKDNRFLLFELRQFDGDPPQGLSLQAFDLTTGKSEIWAHIGSVRGLDWRE